MKGPEKSLWSGSLHPRSRGGGQRTCKKMTILEDGVLKTIKEDYDVIMRNWVLLQIGRLGKFSLSG